MKFSIISTIFKKEMLEVLRDKRMLFLVILMPFFLYPVLFTITGSLGASQQEKLANEQVALWVNSATTQTPLFALLEKDSSYDISVKDFKAEDLTGLKKTMAILTDEDFADKVQQGQSGGITLLADKSQDLLDTRVNLLQQQLKALDEQILAQRLAANSLDMEFVTPIAVMEQDLSPVGGAARFLASFLPMMILMFIFIGCNQIAIDITAGEKERRTLQSLFTTPATTREIIMGKFMAVGTVGIVSALMNVLSLVFAMYVQASFLSESSNFSLVEMSGAGMVWMIGLVLMATLFCAAICLAVLVMANSYKEAQSYVSPLMMTILLPAIMASMPGMELNASTALIPIFNIALALVAILKGTLDVGLLSMVLASSFVYGMAALFFASLTFGNENIITGEKVSLKQLISKK